jgi:hypothetical protein
MSYPTSHQEGKMSLMLDWSPGFISYVRIHSNLLNYAMLGGPELRSL